MWKIIRGTYTASRELLGIIGEGKKFVEDGLNNINKDLKEFRIQVENAGKELDETRPFRQDLHQLELCRIIIEKNKRRTPSSYHNLHKFYDLSNSSITNSISILKKAISEPTIRSLVQDLTKKVKSEFDSSITGNKELAIDLEKMLSKGLKKDCTALEAFEFYLEATPLEELEVKVKPELPAMIAGNNSIAKFTTIMTT